MPLYEYHCSVCQARASFASDFDATTKGGWALMTIQAFGKLRYLVFCANDVPKKIVDDLMGAKKK